jgi:hypothetical protein
MANSIYHINKGINKSIEFKGLRAQYIWYLAAGVLVLLILFVIMYMLDVNSFICIAVIMGAGTGLVMKIYRLSNKYGEHGMMKAIAKRGIPKLLKCNSRKVFKILKDGKQ